MLRTDRPDYRRSKEEDILEGLRSQDPLALAEAYHRTSPAAHACARRLLGGAVGAEALLSAVYADLWADPPETARLEGWVRSRCFRIASEHLRERQEPPAAPSLALLLPDLPRPEHTSSDPVEQTLATLPERERRALLLAHDQGMPTTAQDDPGAADALDRALTALAGPGAGLHDATDEQCDVRGMADWTLGLLEADHAERIGEDVMERRACVERSQALRRGRRRLEGLPPAPDMGQRVLAAVLAGTPAAAPGRSAPSPSPPPVSAPTDEGPRDAAASMSTAEERPAPPPPAFSPPAPEPPTAQPPAPEPPTAQPPAPEPPTAQPPAPEPPTAQPPAPEPPTAEPPAPVPPTAEPPAPEPPTAPEPATPTERMIPFAPLPSALDEEPTAASTAQEEARPPVRDARDETDLDEVAATDTAAPPAHEPASAEDIRTGELAPTSDDVRAGEDARTEERVREREQEDGDTATVSPADDAPAGARERTRDTETRHPAEAEAPGDRKLVRQLLNILAIVVVLAAGGALGLLIGFLLIGGR